MINELITAAAFLYAHSPAERMTAEKNTIIVSGRAGDPLAEAVFDLLFTTAWRAETVIRLVRLVPEGAAEAEQAFICRNEKGIGCFAGNALLEPDENRTMTLCFMDEREYDPRKEADRTAWAVCLDGSAAPVSGDACFSAGIGRRRFPGICTGKPGRGTPRRRPTPCGPACAWRFPSHGS